MPPRGGNNNCRACGHPRRAEIDRQLLAKVHRHHIIKAFPGMTRDVLKSHFKHHVLKVDHYQVKFTATEPNPAPAESLTLPPDALPDHLATVAPVGVAKTAGLPPGATYGQCLRESMMRAAISGDMSAAKDLLERLEGEVSKQPQAPVKVTVNFGPRYKEYEALGTYDNRDKDSCRAFQQRLWDLATKDRLEQEENAPAVLAAWENAPRAWKDELWAEILAVLKEGKREHTETTAATVN